MDKGYPKVRLKEFLRQVSRPERLLDGKLYPTLGVKWYAVGLFSKEPQLGKDIAASKLFRVQQGDFVYNRLFGWKGSFALVDGEYDGLFVSGEFPTFEIDKTQISPVYLKWFFSIPTVWEEISKRSSGASQTSRLRLKEKEFLDIEIPLPTLPEQERIVRLLDEADALRRLRRQADERMKDFTPALFHEMFGGKDYPMAFLRDVSEVVSGVAKGRRLGNAALTIPYLRVANVQAGYLDLSEIKMIEALPLEVEELRLLKGDILLTEGGDFDKLGRGALLEVDLPPNCIHQNHVFRVRVNADKLTPVFFAEYLQTEKAKNYFLQCAKKTTNLASINMTQLRGLPVFLPPISLQREFAARVSEARRVREAQGRSAERVDALFQSLLARAFAGEV